MPASKRPTYRFTLPITQRFGEATAQHALCLSTQMASYAALFSSCMANRPTYQIIVSPFNGCIQQYDNDRKDT